MTTMSITQLRNAPPQRNVRIHLEGRVRKVDLVEVEGEVVAIPCRAGGRDRSADDMYVPLARAGALLGNGLEFYILDKLSRSSP